MTHFAKHIKCRLFVAVRRFFAVIMSIVAGRGGVVAGRGRMPGEIEFLRGSNFRSAVLSLFGVKKNSDDTTKYYSQTKEKRILRKFFQK
jgi:hypothetical protein